MEQQGKIYFTYSVATTRALMLSTFNMNLLLSELYEMCIFFWHQDPEKEITAKGI